MQLTKKDKFDIFVQDLDEKLALHLYEMKEQKLKELEITSVVEVQESEVEPGSFDVYLGGKKKFHFSGAEAHRRATKAAGDLLKD